MVKRYVIRLPNGDILLKTDDEELAEQVSKKTGLPYEDRALKKLVETTIREGEIIQTEDGEKAISPFL